MDKKYFVCFLSWLKFLCLKIFCYLTLKQIGRNILQLILNFIYYFQLFFIAINYLMNNKNHLFLLESFEFIRPSFKLYTYPKNIKLTTNSYNRLAHVINSKINDRYKTKFKGYSRGKTSHIMKNTNRLKNIRKPCFKPNGKTVYNLRYNWVYFFEDLSLFHTKDIEICSKNSELLASASSFKYKCILCNSILTYNKSLNDKLLRHSMSQKHIKNIERYNYDIKHYTYKYHKMFFMILTNYIAVFVGDIEGIHWQRENNLYYEHKEIKNSVILEIKHLIENNKDDLSYRRIELFKEKYNIDEKDSNYHDFSQNTCKVSFKTNNSEKSGKNNSESMSEERKNSKNSCNFVFLEDKNSTIVALINILLINEALGLKTDKIYKLNVLKEYLAKKYKIKLESDRFYIENDEIVEYMTDYSYNFTHEILKFPTVRNKEEIFNQGDFFIDLKNDKNNLLSTNLMFNEVVIDDAGIIAWFKAHYLYNGYCIDDNLKYLDQCNPVEYINFDGKEIEESVGDKIDKKIKNHDSLEKRIENKEKISESKLNLEMEKEIQQKKIKILCKKRSK